MSNSMGTEGQILDPVQLIYGYCQGTFPMAHEGEIYWYDPDPRAILPLDSFHVPRSLQRTIKRGHFAVKINSDFMGVIQGCAEPVSGREETWIDDTIMQSYIHLHRLGHAHSVETWLGDRLVGGLYGVSVYGLFAGESMFSRETDASKVALVALVEQMKAQGLVLLDVQFQTHHLARFGVVEIPRHQYKTRLAKALQKNVRFYP